MFAQRPDGALLKPGGWLPSHGFSDIGVGVGIGVGIDSLSDAAAPETGQMVDPDTDTDTDADWSFVSLGPGPPRGGALLKLGAWRGSGADLRSKKLRNTRNTRKPERTFHYHD